MWPHLLFEYSCTPHRDGLRASSSGSGGALVTRPLSRVDRGLDALTLCLAVAILTIGELGELGEVVGPSQDLHLKVTQPPWLDLPTCGAAKPVCGHPPLLERARHEERPSEQVKPARSGIVGACQAAAAAGSRSATAVSFLVLVFVLVLPAQGAVGTPEPLQVLQRHLEAAASRSHQAAKEVVVWQAARLAQRCSQVRSEVRAAGGGGRRERQAGAAGGGRQAALTAHAQ